MGSSLTFLEGAKRGLAAVLNVQEAVFVLLFFVNCRHQRRIWRDGVRAKQKQSFLRRQFDALTNDVVELSHRQISWNQVFFFVNVGGIRAVRFLANDRDAIRIFSPDALSLQFTFFCRDATSKLAKSSAVCKIHCSN
jgi:hypothetical protein